jgi:aquaporin Z
MTESLKHHWPEYLMEAAGLGLFMISACGFATLLEHPDYPVRSMIDDPWIRRIPMGLAMGLTAVVIIYSPFGRRSGAHINPAVTLTFMRLGKIARWDAAFYILFQSLGGTAGVLVSRMVLGNDLNNAMVNYVVTVPGHQGYAVAFTAEFVMSFVIMAVIMYFTNHERTARYTGLAAAALVMMFIIVEAPLSGMSINPARTLASALPANVYSGFWIYMIAPVAGMFVAAELYIHHRGIERVRCAKLHHHNAHRCIHCGKVGADDRCTP